MWKRISNIVCLILLLCSQWSLATGTDAKPAIPLAKVYHANIDLNQYWVSEKYDGVRAYWDGHQFLSRKGNRFEAPSWFTSGFPNFPLDGELWVGRHSFEKTVSIVKRKTSDKSGWKALRFMVFDLPVKNQTFDQRLAQLKIVFSEINQPFIQLVKQYRIVDHARLMTRLNTVVSAGAEGLMLRRGASHYQAGRSADLLKVKPYYDAEAVVVKHIPGKGKFKGMLGALTLKLGNGQLFRIGSGFTHQQRRNPPKIGSVVTYKFHGLTKNGIPRFASFLRIKK